MGAHDVKPELMNDNDSARVVVVHRVLVDTLATVYRADAADNLSRAPALSSFLSRAV